MLSVHSLYNPAVVGAGLLTIGVFLLFFYQPARSLADTDASYDSKAFWQKVGGALLALPGALLLVWSLS